MAYRAGHGGARVVFISPPPLYLCLRRSRSAGARAPAPAVISDGSARSGYRKL